MSYYKCLPFKACNYRSFNQKEFINKYSTIHPILYPSSCGWITKLPTVTWTNSSGKIWDFEFLIEGWSSPWKTSLGAHQICEEFSDVLITLSSIFAIETQEKAGLTPNPDVLDQPWSFLPFFSAPRLHWSVPCLQAAHPLPKCVHESPNSQMKGLTWHISKKI